MRTIPFIQTSTGLQKAPKHVTADHGACYVSQSHNNPIGDQPLLRDASSASRENDIETYEQSPPASPLQRDEDTEADFWKRLLLAEAGWYGHQCHPDNIDEEVEKALLKIQREGTSMTTMMESLRTRVGWNSEDDSFVSGTESSTPYSNVLSTRLYSGLGLDRIESSWRDITMKLVSI